MTRTVIGNYIIMKDDETKQGFLYGHMREASPLNIGDNVDYNDYVGHEGTTGNSTGIHLHLMQQDLTNSDTWTFGLPISQLKNPAEYLGIPNELGISAIYNGTPKPFKKKSNNWLKIMSRKMIIRY